MKDSTSHYPLEAFRIRQEQRVHRARRWLQVERAAKSEVASEFQEAKAQFARCREALLLDSGSVVNPKLRSMAMHQFAYCQVSLEEVQTRLRLADDKLDAAERRLVHANAMLEALDHHRDGFLQIARARNHRLAMSEADRDWLLKFAKSNAPTEQEAYAGE